MRRNGPTSPASEPQQAVFPEWMDLKTAQAYACVSDRKLREWVHLPVNPLPASQPAGGKILIKRSNLDAWLEAHPYQPINSINVDRITDEIIDQFRKAA
jgi:excisionase family DNA binding protein